jgi:hypothetical protein
LSRFEAAASFALSAVGENRGRYGKRIADAAKATFEKSRKLRRSPESPRDAWRGTKRREGARRGKRSMRTPSIDCAIAWVEGSRTRVEAGANGEGEGPAAEHVRGGRDGELLRGDVAFRRDSELWGGRRGMRGSANRKKTSSRGGPRERARRAPIARAARLGRRNGGDVGNSHEKKRRGGRVFFDASRAGLRHRAASRDRVHARGRTLPVARAFMSCILSCCWGGC